MIYSLIFRICPDLRLKIRFCTASPFPAAIFKIILPITKYEIPDFEKQAVFFGFNSLFPTSCIHQKRAVEMENHSQLFFNSSSSIFEI